MKINVEVGEFTKMVVVGALCSQGPYNYLACYSSITHTIIIINIGEGIVEDVLCDIYGEDEFCEEISRMYTIVKYLYNGDITMNIKVNG